MTRAAIPFLAAIAILAPRLIAAQPFTADFRVVTAAPTQSMAGADLDPGIGLGVVLAWRVMPHLHVLGAWDWLHFNSARSFAGSHMDFEETGYSLGLRFEHPLRDEAPVSYRIEGAATWKHIEIENYDGGLIADSGHDAGVEAGAGLRFPLRGAWNLAPMVRYRSLPGDFQTTSFAASGQLKYVAVELAISRRF
jgi:hypothetical protein